MIQKLHIAIGLFCFVLGFASCSDDQYYSDYSKPFSNGIVFSCQSLWGENTPMIWTNESKIGLFCKQTQTENMELKPAAISAGEANGLFYTKIPWGEGIHDFYLYTPYSQGNKVDRVVGSLDPSQMQNGNSFTHIQQMGFSYAKVSSEEVDAPIKVDLKHAFATLDFEINTAAWQGWTLESIKITSKSARTLAGKFTFDLQSEKMSFLEDGTPSVLLRISNLILGAEKTHAYLAVAKDQATAGGEVYDVELNVAKEGELSMAITGSIRVADPEVPISLSIDGFDSKPTEDNSINLSEVETANCYIANQAGKTYRFDATVMGNGFTTPATAGNERAMGITPAKLAPVQAKLLWQTLPGLVIDVKLRSNHVYFTLNGEVGGNLMEGNAVIAVFDASDQVLWSWHIWVTAADLDALLQSYKLPNDYAQAGTTLVMDRNLGALKKGMKGSNNDNLALGLLYQWGRKDPFPNLDDAYDGGKGALPITQLRPTYDDAGQVIPVDNVEAVFSNNGWHYVSGKAIPNAEIARYPMSFAYDSGNGNWIVDAQDDLWGNAPTEEIGETGHKSIYDPCPVGYRVAHRYFATAFTVDGKSYKTGAEGNLGQYKNGNDIQNASGNIFPCESGNAEYPLAGMFFYNSGHIVPFRTGKYVGAYHVCQPTTDPKKSYRFYIDYGNTKPLDSNQRYVGSSVRCIKDIQK